MIQFEQKIVSGKKILITGGGSGLGKSMALELARLGAEIWVCGRTQETLDQTVHEINHQSSPKAYSVVCDIRKPESIEECLNLVFKKKPLDGLINCAAGNFLSRSEDLSTRALDAVLNIVLHGTAYMTLACGQRWLKLKHTATVLSIITTYAQTGSAFVLPSAMGKAGVLAMTQSLAVEWAGRGIRLNAIAPGPFPTKGAWDRLVPGPEFEQHWMNRVPMKRLGKHEELTNLVCFLMSDLSPYINGDVITIDGGEWLKGAGQFTFVGDHLSQNDWKNLKPLKKSN